MDRVRPTCRSSVESGQSAPPGQKGTSDNPVLLDTSGARQPRRFDLVWTGEAPSWAMLPRTTARYLNRLVARLSLMIEAGRKGAATMRVEHAGMASHRANLPEQNSICWAV